MSDTTSKAIDYRVLVAEVEGEEYPETEHIAYEFSKKTFYEDDSAGNYEPQP